MQNEKMPTEGENSAKLEAESALRDAACCASSFRIIAEPDSEDFVVFPPPGMDRLTFTRGGARRFANILMAWSDGKLGTITGKAQSVSFQTRDSAKTPLPSSLPVDPLSDRVQDSPPPTAGKAPGTDDHDTPQSAVQPPPVSNHDHQGLKTGIACCDIPNGSCDGGGSSIILHNDERMHHYQRRRTSITGLML
jgi:hypothetical protein